MDDFWNRSNTAPSTLDTFFDEDSDVTWTGLPSHGDTSPRRLHHGDEVGSDYAFIIDDAASSSILDNVSLNCDSASSSSIIGQGGKSRIVGHSIGGKIDSLKPASVSIKRNAAGTEGRQCSQCLEKDEEISLLRKRLERSYSRNFITLAPEDAVNRILLGQPCSLEFYKSKEDKLALLDSALQTLDSSTVLTIILFVRNTLKKSMFNQELQTRPYACQLYLSYLKQRAEYTEALNFMGMLGRTEDAAMLKYKLALASRGTETRVKNLKNALQTHFSGSLKQEAKVVHEHILLLEYQISVDQKDSQDQSNPLFKEYPRAGSLIDKSHMTTLYYLCMYHWNAPESSPLNPLVFKRQFGISDKQFLWTVLRARARIGHWPLPNDLEALLGNKSVLGTLSSLVHVSGKSVKDHLPIERVVETLATNGASLDVLAAYLNLLSSQEVKLKLALANNCHQAVIDVYVVQKDRQALDRYVKSLPEGTPEYKKAEHALKNTRW